MASWFAAALPYIAGGAVTLLLSIGGWLVKRVELVLAQVRKINGTVANHQQWIDSHQKASDEAKGELQLAIAGLENRERERLQAEVVEARAKRRR